jgi:hypothetical protein
MNYQEAAQSALDVQNAVNASGAVRSFAEAMSALWDETHRTGRGTAWVNEHPVTSLFLSKLADLNRQSFADYSLMNHACENIVKGLPDPFLWGQR